MNPTYNLQGIIAQIEQQIGQLLKIQPQEQLQVPNKNIEDRPLLDSVQEYQERNSVYSSQRTSSNNSSQVLLNLLLNNLDCLKKGINDILNYNKNGQQDQLKNNQNTKEVKNKGFARSENIYDSEQNKGIYRNLKLDVQESKISVNSYAEQIKLQIQEMKQIQSNKTISDLQKKQKIQYFEQQQEELRKNFVPLRQLQENIMQLFQLDSSFQDTLRQCKPKI